MSVLVLVLRLVLLHLGCWSSTGRTFNLEPRIAILKEGPKETYFGFSVAQHQILTRGQIESAILVGAPLDTYDGGGHQPTGVLYKCPFTSRNHDCVKVLDIPSNRDRRSLLEASGQWLGVDVKSQGPGKQVIVCAHRYVKNETDQRWGHGQCFTLTQELKHSATWDPCQGREKNWAHEEWGYCQAGTSALLSDDQFALIGSPGPFTWRGTVFAFSIADDFLFRDKTHYYVPVKGGEAPVDKYSYLGMSITAGNFLPKSRSCGNELTYASGAPRAGGTGKVVIFAKCNSELLRVEKILDGEDFASSFGYSLASADINGDGFQDLFVGAPFFHHLANELSEFRGAVYVYMNGPDGLPDKSTRRLTGSKHQESRFGFSITNAGDLNNDGLADVVIGAPYDGNGKVYVYMGKKSEVVEYPDQIITAEELPFKGIKTFGYSLAGGIDYDFNNFTDIVVGAYESDSVIVVRSRPVIDIETWFGKKPDSIRPELPGCEGDVYSPEVCFVIESCFLIKNFPTNIETTHIRYRLDAEIFAGGFGRKVSRIRFGDNRSNSSHTSEKIVAVERTSLTGCFQETAYMREGTSDIRTPIRFHLTLQLQQDEPRYLGADYGVANINQYPILNQREAHKELEIPFHKSCGGDDLCQSKLQASMEIVGQNHETGQLEIREREEAVVKIYISNEGEPAYSAEMELKIDSAFSYVGRSDDEQDIHCDFHQSSRRGRIICKLGNPYAQNRTSLLMFRMLPVSLLAADKTISFNVTVNTTSEDVLTDKQRKLNIPVVLIKRAEVSIRSLVQPNKVWHSGQALGESAMRVLSDIGPRVIHTFQVTNDGPWHVDNMEVQIQWPYQLAPPLGRKSGFGKWLLYLTGIPEIAPLGAGQCFVNPRTVNSLGLRERGLSTSRINSTDFFISSDSSVTRKKRSAHVSDLSAIQYNHHNTDTSDFQTLSNSESGYVAFTMDSNAQIVLDCSSDQVQCHTFSCRINKLRANESAVIRIKSRLWNSTLVEEFPGQELVVIQSRALILLPMPLNKYQVPDNDETVSQLFIAAGQNSNENAGIEDVPLWIILVSVIVGLIVVTFITLTLLKLGFFRRNRLSNDIMISAKVTSSGYQRTRTEDYIS